MKRLLILPMMLIATTAYGAGWDETVTTPSGDDTVMINDVSAAPGSTSQFTAFKNFPVPTAVQSLLDDKEPLKGADDNYVTNAEKVVIGNTSNTNSGDQNISGIATNAGDITTLEGRMDTAETDIGNNTTAIGGKEASLGNPSSNGQVLSSNTGGTRSWIDPPSGGTGIADGTAIGDITRWSGTEWLPEAPVQLPVDSFKTVGVELHFNAAQLETASATPDEGMAWRVLYDVTAVNAYMDCNATYTGLVVTLEVSSTRYGTAVSTATVNVTGSNVDISSLGSILKGQYIRGRVSTASTGGSTECDVSSVYTIQ